MRKLILASLVCIGVVSVGNADIDIEWCDGLNFEGIVAYMGPCHQEAIPYYNALRDCSYSGDPKECNKVMPTRLRLEDCRRRRCER